MILGKSDSFGFFLQSFAKYNELTELLIRDLDMASTWQHSSLEDTNLHMLENEILCDITFLVGEEREPVKCHKYMLVSRSPVFYSMFCGTLAELGDTVSVPDSEPEIWKLFLRSVLLLDSY